MAAKLLILVACFALTQGAMVRRHAPENDILKDMIRDAEEVRKVFENQLNEFAKSKDGQDLQKILKESITCVGQQLETFAKSLESLVKDASGKAQNLIEQSQKNVEKMVNDLRKSHGDVEKNADALGNKLKEAVDKTIKETQIVAKHLAQNVADTNDKVAPKLKVAFDDFVKDAQEIGKKLQEAVVPK